MNLNGTWTLPDDFLLAIAQKTQNEGTFQTVFYEGDIRTPDDFLQMMKLPLTIAVFAFSGDRPIGFAWLNGTVKNLAFAHFCFLKDSWGKDTLKGGQMIIDYWRNFPDQAGEPLFDVIFGVTPSGYGAALKYIKRLGFKRMGTVPGMLKNAYAGERDSAVISYLSRFE